MSLESVISSVVSAVGTGVECAAERVRGLEPNEARNLAEVWFSRLNQ